MTFAVSFDLPLFVRVLIRLSSSRIRPLILPPSPSQHLSPVHTISITFSLTDYLSRGFSIAIPNNVRPTFSLSLSLSLSLSWTFSHLPYLRLRSTQGSLLLIQPPAVSFSLPCPKLSHSSSISLSLFDVFSLYSTRLLSLFSAASWRLHRVFSLPSSHPAFAPRPPTHPA